MPLTILNFSRAWQEHFLSHTLQTWQVYFFFVDVQMILLSLLDTSDCFKVEKNEKAFLSSCSELLDPTYSNSYFFKVGKRPVFMQATVLISCLVYLCILYSNIPYE